MMQFRSKNEELEREREMWEKAKESEAKRMRVSEKKYLK